MMTTIKADYWDESFLTLDKENPSDGQVLKSIAKALEGKQYGCVCNGKSYLQLTIPVRLIPIPATPKPKPNLSISKRIFLIKIIRAAQHQFLMDEHNNPTGQGAMGLADAKNFVESYLENNQFPTA